MSKPETIRIFGNRVPEKDVKKAMRNQSKLARKFDFDPQRTYDLSAVENETLYDCLGIKNIISGSAGEEIDPKKSVVLGTIRMGFGHYRIAMALASAAKSKGLTPYWFDMMAFKDSTATKIINHLNFLYSLGSRISQKVELFNRYYWEPLNSEGFKKLSFNASDLKMTELMTDICKPLPREIPFVASHAWPAQTALAAGLQRVVNVIPDNWPMALHLAEGAIHTVQSDSSYLGYRLLREMGEKDEMLKPIPAKDIRMTGHYVDHELVANLESDCNQRLERIKKKKERRVLLSVGGAGAQLDALVDIVNHMLPDIKKDKIALFINVGDHENVWQGFERSIPDLKHMAQTHFNDLDEVNEFAARILSKDISGIHAFYNKDIFAAVYATNLLMRGADLMITKPSELAFYPVPKLFIKRVGGHEMWGAIRGAEIGDATIECNTDALLYPTLDMLLKEDELLAMYCENIKRMNQIGVYNGAYNVIDLALKG